MPEVCANPLLLEWLKEWMDEAQARNSKGYTVYKKAYQSMKACPLAFDHPSEAQQLNGLGPKLCDRLAEKLKKHCAENGLPMPVKTGPKSRARPGELGSGDAEVEQPAKKPRKAQLYVPKLRSGAYALIMALGELDQEGKHALTKTDLIEKAQPLCDSSFTAPTDPTKFYTAWASMKTLESKELVCTKGHPTKRYYLSDEGWEVALRMQATAQGGPRTATRQGGVKDGQGLLSGAVDQMQGTQTGTNPFDLEDLEAENDGYNPLSRALPKPISIGDSGLNASSETVSPTAAIAAAPIVLPAGSFEVQMVLDTREIRTTRDRDYLANELLKQDVIADTRALPLADVLWIAKVKSPYDEGLKSSNHGDEEEGSTEIVLEHAVERKRLDDLIGSIKDGRFHEQKFRLRKSGLRNITYLIEDYSISTEKGEKYGEAVESAIASMQVVNDIFVKQTSKIDETIRYLARMTHALKAMYEKKDLCVIPSRYLDVATHWSTLDKRRDAQPDKVFCITFSAFASLCDKSDSMTLRDVFLRMLMCIRGVTGDKAIEIQKVWPTPQDLIEAYDRHGADTKKKQSMISDRLGNAIPRKKVARALSGKIAEVWAGGVEVDGT